MMASCSKDTPVDPNQEPWVSDLSLPVPIELGSSGFQFETKAEMITNDNLQNYPLRLFAVDKDSKFSLTQTESKTTLFANELAYYDKDAAKIVFGDKGDSKVWYYPYASSSNYSFYAYHVDSGASEPVVEKPQTSTDALFTLIDLNGQQSDILWAKAEATPYGSIKGFNAKYMRAIASAQDKDSYMPSLNFQHVTTAIKFEFKIEEESGNDQEEYQYDGVKVESLTLKNIPRYVNLWIADKDYPEREGTLTKSGRYADMPPVEMDCSDVTMGAVGEITELGTLFVMVPEDIEAIVVDMIITVPLSNDTTDQVPATLNLKSADGFKPGSRYSYQITMKSPQDIRIKASVNPWTDGDEGTGSYVEGTTPNENGSLTIE